MTEDEEVRVVNEEAVWRGALNAEEAGAPTEGAWKGRYYYLKHAPFVYSRSVMRLANQLFRKEILHTFEHKFRHG